MDVRISPREEPRRMSQNQNKTLPTQDDVETFLSNVKDEKKRADSLRLRDLMESVTGEQAVLWGPSIVGFGTYHYRYDSGREGDAPAIGFAPRSANITLYVVGSLDDHAAILHRLGKHTTGKSCVYVKRLSDVDENALTDLIRASVEKAKEITAESQA
jgi:hypothetical protein